MKLNYHILQTPLGQESIYSFFEGTLSEAFSRLDSLNKESRDNGETGKTIILSSFTDRGDAEQEFHTLRGDKSYFKRR